MYNSLTKWSFRRWLLEPVLVKLDIIEQKENELIMSFVDIDREVTEATTVMSSAVALIKGLAAEIREHIDNAAALAELANKLDTSANELAAAVVENTPSEPAPEEPTPEA